MPLVLPYKVSCTQSRTQVFWSFFPRFAHRLSLSSARWVDHVTMSPGINVWRIVKILCLATPPRLRFSKSATWVDISLTLLHTSYTRTSGGTPMCKRMSLGIWASSCSPDFMKVSCIWSFQNNLVHVRALWQHRCPQAVEPEDPGQDFSPYPPT